VEKGFMPRAVVPAAKVALDRADIGVAELASYDQYGDAAHVKRANRKDFVGNVLNAVVVTKWEGEEYAAGKERRQGGTVHSWASGRIGAPCQTSSTKITSPRTVMARPPQVLEQSGALPSAHRRE